MTGVETVPPDRHRWLIVQRLFAGILLIGAAVVLLFAALLARHAAHTPFPGLFTEPTLVVNSIGDPAWNGYAAGLRIPEQLVAVDDRPLEDTGALMRALTGYHIGDTVTLRARHAETGVEREVQVQLTSLPRTAVRDFFLAPYFLAWFYLLAGAWVFLVRGHEEAGLLFACFCVCVALITGLILDLYTTHRLFLLWVIAIPMTGSIAAHLGLVFPQEARILLHYPALRYLVYLPGLALAMAGLKTTLDWTSPIAYFGPWIWGRAWGGGGILVMVGLTVHRRYLSRSPIVQAQGRTVLWGALLSFTPIIVWIVLAFQTGFPFDPLLILPPLAIFPVSIAYVLLRYRLPDIDWALRHGLIYALLTLLMAGTYSLFLFLLGWLFRATIRPDSPLVLGGFVLLAALLLNPARLAIQRAVDRILLGKRVTYEEALTEFSRAVMVTVKPEEVTAALAQALKAALGSVEGLLFLFDERKGRYVPSPLGKEEASRVTFRRDGPLARLMLQRGSPVFLHPDRPLPPALAPERALLNRLDALLYVPVPDHGWLALPAPRGKRGFQTADLHFLQTLAAQMATALEQVRLISDLERRVRELEALRLIAQSVSYAVELDDLLELIYTQAGRILDITNFYIALHDPETQTLRFAFYVEDGERRYLDDVWPDTEGLSGVIVRSGRPIITDDYLAECRRHGVRPGGKPGKAWMGMPLISRDQVLGVMNVSSFDPDVTYTEEQAQVFQAIADQAAGILDKARLYQMMQKRALQLETLNEVGGVITSTLELDAVLDLIMQKAIDLLQAEAGSLLLVDEETGDLVFQVTTGPRTADLVGTRLPMGTGIVGRVAESARAIIVDDVQRDERWYPGLDERSDFTTRSVVCVPMVARGRVIGVIELLNRQDGHPFTPEDRHLLTAFAAHAAVAIENARLFTMTDQALAARVEELSMMQRIDRELNATLDYQRVMETALDWALRMTGADIGLMAIIVETEDGQRGLRFLANRGYPEELVAVHREELWPLEQGLIGRVVRSGEPELVENVGNDPDYVPAVAGMAAQLTVPIRREEQIVGVIALESSERGRLDQGALEFVSRLADHAAIAIENARLFEAVQAANEAKTEFVSFVSHELKQPMTSIKGYADLLTKGTAGELTETQRSFIEIIRSNVARMDALVQDLLDISRIETGRLTLEIGRVAMEEAVKEAVQLVQRQVEAKDQALEVQVCGPLPPVTADRNRLVQVLTNLLSNAYKYTPKGGHIRVLVEPADGRFVRCSVSDTGIGMTQDEQNRLFTKYFRSQNPVVRGVPGTGLGLVITKSLVELQGGEIWVESEPGKGSTFTFTVPVADEYRTSDPEP